VLLGLIGILMGLVVKDLTDVVGKVDGQLVNALAVQVIFGVFENFGNLQVVDRTIHQWAFNVNNPTEEDLVLQKFTMDVKLESTKVCNSQLGTQSILPPKASSKVYFLTQLEEEHWLYLAGGQVVGKATLGATADVGIGIAMDGIIVGQALHIYAPCNLPIDMSHFPSLGVQNLNTTAALQELADITTLKKAITSGLERNHAKDVTIVEWESAKMEGGLFTKVYVLLGLLTVCITPIITCLVVVAGVMYEVSTKGRIDDRSYIADVMLAQEQRDAAAAAGGARGAGLGKQPCSPACSLACSRECLLARSLACSPACPLACSLAWA